VANYIHSNKTGSVLKGRVAKHAIYAKEFEG